MKYSHGQKLKLNFCLKLIRDLLACHFEGKDGENRKSKYDKIREKFVKRYQQDKVNENVHV